MLGTRGATDTHASLTSVKFCEEKLYCTITNPPRGEKTFLIMFTYLFMVKFFFLAKNLL